MRKSTVLITTGICLILCGGLLPAVAWIACYFMPREYTTVAIINLKPSQALVVSTFGTDPHPNDIDPHFVGDQIQIIQSKAILYPVIDELNLVDKWSAGLAAKLSREEAYQTLLKMAKVGMGKDATLLNISITSTDRREAADIANTIAVTYQSQRRNDMEQQITNALSDLNAAVQKQRQKVQQAVDELTRIRLRNANPDVNPDAPGIDDERNIIAEETKLNEAKQRVEEAKALLDKINQLSPDELLNAVPRFSIPDDATISEIVPKYQVLRADEARLVQSGAGDNDPRLKAVRAREAVFKKQLQDALDAVKKNLQARLDIAQNNLDSEQKIYEDTMANAQNKKTQDQEYITAKQNYLNEKRLLDNAEKKYEADKMELEIELVPVEIWDRAEPPREPSSPNVPRIMMVSSGLGFLCALCGAGLLVIGLRFRRLETALSSQSKIKN